MAEEMLSLTTDPNVIKPDSYWGKLSRAERIKRLNNCKRKLRELSERWDNTPPIKGLEYPKL